VLAKEIGEDAIRANWDDQEREIAEEFSRTRARSARAQRGNTRVRAPRIAEMLQRWGGVTIAYRRRLIDSPSYTLNHEEVEKALEEGIVFAEGLTPARVETDNYGAVRGNSPEAFSGAEHWFPAHTVFVAPERRPTQCSRVRTPRIFRSTASTSPRATRTATRSSRRFDLQARRAACASRAPR